MQEHMVFSLSLSLWDLEDGLFVLVYVSIISALGTVSAFHCSVCLFMHAVSVTQNNNGTVLHLSLAYDASLA